MLNSLVTIFIVIMGEDWNQVLYLYVRALGADNNELGWQLARTYFLIIMITGNVILLALFTSLLLKNFDREADKGAEESSERLSGNRDADNSSANKSEEDKKSSTAINADED